MVELRAIGAAAMLAVSISIPIGAQPISKAFTRDAEAVAKLKGISPEEAMRRLALEAKTMKLIRYLKINSQYVDSVIESTSDVFKIRVYVKPAGVVAALAAPLMSDVDLQESLQIEATGSTTDRLRDIQKEIINKLASARVESVVRIDVRASRVVVQTRDPDQVARLLDHDGYRNFVIIEKRENFPRPTASVGGGLSVTSPKGCTSGFGAIMYDRVNYRDHKYGVLTAAHCAKNTRSGSLLGKTLVVDGTSFNIEGSAWNSTQDVLWTSKLDKSTYVSNRIRDGSFEGRHIFNFENSVAIGASMCKYGKTTGYTCQRVLNNAYIHVALSGEITGPMVELGAGAANIAQCGDSGGPIFIGEVGYGLTHAGDANGSCQGGPSLIYSEVGAFPNDFGVPVPE